MKLGRRYYIWQVFEQEHGDDIAAAAAKSLHHMWNLPGGANPCPLHWEVDSLSTVPPGKSHTSFDVSFALMYPVVHSGEYMVHS